MAETVRITDQLGWNSDETEAELNGLVSNEATVVATLNWSYLTSDKYNDFFTLRYDDGFVYAAGVGMYDGLDLNLIYTDDFDWSPGYLPNAGAYQGVSGAIDDEAAIVFTIVDNGGQLTLNGYLYLWSAGAEAPTCTHVTYTGSGLLLPSSNIVLSPTLIKDVEVYTGITDDPELLATTLKNQVTPSEPETPAVPEPTTATLSLLALSALAARRRRR